MKKTFVLLAIVVVLGLLIGGYFIFKHQVPVSTTVQPVVENNAWKTYSNPQNGFEVKYPSNYVSVTGTQPDGVFVFQDGDASKDQIAVQSLTHNPENELRDVNQITHDEPYIFMSVSGKKLTGQSGVTGKAVSILIFEKNGSFFTISASPILFDQVLATFKFTK